MDLIAIDDGGLRIGAEGTENSSLRVIERAIAILYPYT
jgi:hypothetical protein